MAVIQLIQEQLDFGNGKITVSLDRNLRTSGYAWNSGRHVNSAYELHLVLTGAAEFCITDRLFLLQENRGIILSPNQPHYAKSLSGAFERFSVHFSLEGRQLIQTLLPDGDCCRIFTLSPQIREVAGLILSELREESPLSRKAIRAYLHLLFIHLLRDLGLKDETVKSENNDEEAKRKVTIDTYFSSRMPFGCGKERLAKELGVSERQLGRILQELYGKSFRELLHRSRMENSAWMLSSSDLPVGEIALSLKYATEVPFCQAFRKWYGMTPTEYRKLYKNSYIKEL